MGYGDQAIIIPQTYALDNGSVTQRLLMMLDESFEKPKRQKLTDGLFHNIRPDVQIDFQ